MTIRTEALSIDTLSWKLILRTNANPVEQLSGLAKILIRHNDIEPLTAGLEVKAPGYFPSKESIQPTIFENSIYTLTVRPKAGWKVTAIRHPVLRDLEDSLDEDAGVWRGTIKTGNDIGWFTLDIVVQEEISAQFRTDSIAWQVWPLKLNYTKDLKMITSAIEQEYPLWIFRFGSLTENDAGSSSGRNDRFLLLWFTQFQKIWNSLEKGLSIIVQNPHMTLEAHPISLRPEKIKGKLSFRLEEKISAATTQSQTRYETEQCRSSRNSPENRFVKHVLDECLIGLERFRTVIDRPGLSPSFRDRINEWIRSVARIKANPLFRGIDPFNGLSTESLVLHNRTGYSAVYRSWLELRYSLEFFARTTSTRIGMRSINELYEIWCFIEVRNILRNLGFNLEKSMGPNLRITGVQREIDNSASFHFIGDKGLELTLTHEPVYNRTGSRDLICYTVSQRPDIVLEAYWPASNVTPERRLLWIFDAKYRLKTKQTNNGWNRDEGTGRSAEYLVPPDALDQMHRYRDSILLRLEGEKSRPIISAFALYPGILDQTTDQENNPYAEAIEEVGIGAFPLVPGDNGNRWLKLHLKKALELKDPAIVTGQGSVRIPVTGLQYPYEDVLIVYLSLKRDPAYLQKFKDGYADCFHLYCEGGPSESRMNRVQYLAVIDVPDSTRIRMIRGAYLITEKTIVKRYSISSQKSGTTIAKNISADCYLLSIGHYLQLSKPIPISGDGGNWFRYASLDRLFEARSFAEMCTIYESD